MNWFDRWFAKKSKYVWDESKKQGNGLPVSRADYDYLNGQLKSLMSDYIRLNLECVMLRRDLDAEKKEQKDGEYYFVVQDWKESGPIFRSEQDDWPPVGTRFVSVK
jgi:hypothetical protein